MNYREPLSQRAVAISISTSPDMALLGLGPEHLDDAMTEVARHLLAMGARLLYGGDLREHGFSRLLFELVARHRRDADLGDERVGVSNYLAWPVHAHLSADRLIELSNALKGSAEVLCMGPDGTVVLPEARGPATTAPATDKEWADGLTAMRMAVRSASDARIVLGGTVEGFKGRMPGVAEEALLSLENEQPLFLLGGFGGCTFDIAVELGLTPNTGPNRSWLGRGRFSGFSVDSLRNGLTANENKALVATAHIDQAVALVLRGFLRQEKIAGN
ncbi:MAG: hypothetical protein EOS54_20330 [Mesorhizobium sp.]|uniref:hypothetical protein n=1 Tax=unclassified Mesorhizobium TaxID=325217 RepID=UPI000F763B7B|nr:MULTISPECIES: hypothetical protein [unclassified Mesorhizobium]AZO47632.1 hypothetical protein EJ073_07090 [Mesorhizobium sp. M4B.F.Ca.ET.058.02.1.1]RVC41172.1 hypothetical protein EN781_27050 [Mesorhizobium sp. M4A.F.Ca.ET.090.04.2.1]RWC51262.1 MAG: hypothetical protein EOS54_20330 [Mesorhizobium sp.]RWD52033.1 MAG: hypothetical protein EOS75_30720 [Mesorhizobium sp.]TIU71546.1 MAG: hypothetical protein E5W25_03715 [Mesorhizobium sp.]